MILLRAQRTDLGPEINSSRPFSNPRFLLPATSSDYAGSLRENFTDADVEANTTGIIETVNHGLCQLSNVSGSATTFDTSVAKDSPESQVLCASRGP